MALSFGNKSVATVTAEGPTSIQNTIINNKLDGNVVIAMFSSSLAPAASITYNGVPMTYVYSWGNITYYYIKEPGDGLGTVVATDTAGARMALALQTVNGVSQSTPTGSTFANQSPGTGSQYFFIMTAGGGRTDSVFMSAIFSQGNQIINTPAFPLYASWQAHVLAWNQGKGVHSSVASAGESHYYQCNAVSSGAAIELIAGVFSPVITTGAGTNVLQTSVTLNGTVDSIGSTDVTEEGFYYKVGTSGDPTSGDSVISSTGIFPTGAFSEDLTGLVLGGKYRVAAFATNSIGTSVGSTVQVELLGTKVVVSGTTGPFSAIIEPLASVTTYHIRAFATNSNGTTYGSDTMGETAKEFTPQITIGG